ncbi:MAG: vWA domain-containing protein [Candidatus Binatia bacterium]
MIFTRLDLLYGLLPLVLLVLFIKWRRRKSYFTHPLLFYLRERIRPASPLVHLPGMLEYLALGLLLIAVINPVLPSGEHSVMKEGLDIILVLDLSSSMQEPIDLKGAIERRRLGIAQKEKTRLDAVRDAMITFVQKRRSDRIGVVVFSENGYVVTPMTVDTPYLTSYLRMVDNKTLASEGQTAIGEGILTAIHLSEQQSRDRSRSEGKLMIILTDGENNTGRDPFMAIQKAEEAGFKIYFIGVEVEKARDAPRLIGAVRATGGDYYDVQDARQVEEAYLHINRIEKTTFFTKQQMTQVPRFYPFALTSLILLAASIGIRAIPYFIEIS